VRTWAIVVGSVGVHALAVLAISRCELEIPVRSIATTPPTPVEVAVDVAPIGFEIVELPSSGNATSTGSTGSVGSMRGTTHGGSSTGTGSEGLGPTRTPTESLRMRGRRHDLSISGDALDRILANTKPLQPIATDERLEQHGSTHLIYDRVATVIVSPDGTARFADKRDIDPKLTLPIMSFDNYRKGLGQALTAWYADPYRDQRAGRIQDLPRHLTAVPGACGALNDPMCDLEPETNVTQKSLSRGIIPVVGGSADLTAYLHRKFIGDPYASRKLKLLDTTREARAEIGSVHRAEQRDRASEFAQRNLDVLWKATTDLAERKAALFEMWDECSEDESKDGEAGERARAIVLGWIRAKLPQGSPGAFTVEEIAKLDANRTSRQHFVPY
jgi:hypothetical protein